MVINTFSQNVGLDKGEFTNQGIVFYDDYLTLWEDPPTPNWAYLLLELVSENWKIK